MSTIDLFACTTGAFVLMTMVLIPYYLHREDGQADDVEQLQRQLTQQRRDAQATLEAARVRQAQELSDMAQAEVELVYNLDEARTDLAEAQLDLQLARDALLGAEEQARRSEQSLEACEASRAQLDAQLQALQSQLDDTGQRLRVAERSRQQSSAACSSIEPRNFLLILMSWNTVDDIDLHVVDPDGRRFYYENRINVGSDGSLEEDNVRGPGNEVWLHPTATPGSYQIYYNFYRRRSDAPVVVRGAVFHQQGRIELPTVSLNKVMGDAFYAASPVASVKLDPEGGVRVQ